MDPFARSPELELQSIRVAVKKIREKERSYSKQFDLGKYVTYWDADDARVKFCGQDIRMPTEFGVDVVLTHVQKNPDNKSVYLTLEQIVGLQFASRDYIKTIFSAFEVFAHDGGIRMLEMSAPGLEHIQKFCSKMDRVILDESYVLRDQGVKSIFGRMFSEMGGESVLATDRVGMRVKFFRDLAALYRDDKEKWKPEMRRFKMIKG